MLTKNQLKYKKIPLELHRMSVHPYCDIVTLALN